MEKAEMRLVQRAINQGWSIPEGIMAVLPNQIIRIIGDRNSSTRDRMRAMELMMKMVESNAERELDSGPAIDGVTSEKYLRLMNEATSGVDPTRYMEATQVSPDPEPTVAL